MSKYVPIEKFWELSAQFPVIDVRAPIEFQKGHIPNAINLPLFDDEQREEIGTIYHNQGRNESVLRGLEIVGPKMREMSEAMLEIADGSSVLLQCWRGGMRSRSVGWLAEQVDVQSYVLQGGYKAFRKYVLETFRQPLNLQVVSGLTGAGKTQQIYRLEQAGEQAIDLEKLANHRGSAFGGIGQGDQPSVEHFENELFSQISKLDKSRRVWIEDESRMIGSARLPHHLYAQLRLAPAYFMNVSPETRTELILQQYGDLSREELIEAIHRITKRLGGQHAKDAAQCITIGNIKRAVEILLEYYDRLYRSNRDRMTREVFVDFDVADPCSESTTNKLIELAESACQNVSA